MTELVDRISIDVVIYQDRSEFFPNIRDTREAAAKRLADLAPFIMQPHGGALVGPDWLQIKWVHGKTWEEVGEGDN